MSRPFPNKFPGRCKSCGSPVKASEGFCVRNAAGKYDCYCASTQCLPGESHEAARALPKVKELRSDGSIVMPYDPQAITLLRATPAPTDGRPRFVKATSAWNVSLAMADRPRLLEIADKLGLEVAPELREIVLPEALRETLEEGKAKGLYPFQAEGVEWLGPMDRALLGDDMGLGKTLQVLFALPRGARAVVVCPNSLKFNWRDETLRWRPDLTPVVLKGKKSFRFPREDGEIILVNYDILPPRLMPKDTGRTTARGYKIVEAELDEAEKALASKLVLVVDECQMVKNYKAARSKKVKELAKLAAKVWFLSGTPLKNRPPDLYGVLESGDMAYKVFGGWKRFMALFGAFKTRWGGIEWGSPAAEVPELLRRVMLRRLKKDVLPDLPDKTYREVVVNGLDKRLAAELDEAWAEYGDFIKETDELPPFEEFSALRAKLATSRISALEELVAAREDAETPVVVFSAHRTPVEALGAREGWAMILGGTPAEKRNEIVKAFQAGELKGIALTIRAGGTGLTLTAASEAIFLDRDWTPSENWQAEDRICRIGQTANKCLITTLVSDHVLDRHVNSLLLQKQALIEGAVERTVKVTPKPVEKVADLREESEDDFVARMDAITEAAREAEREALRDKIEHNDWLGRARGRSNRPEPVLTPERVEATREAFQFMLGRCDGAKRKDGVGFNKPDAAMAKLLIFAGLEDISFVRIAERMLSRYHRQLHENFPILFVENGAKKAS